jgi:hypothetical protein
VTLPSSSTRTFCKLGSCHLRVLMFEWLTL